MTLIATNHEQDMTLPFASLHAALAHVAQQRLDKTALIHEGGTVSFRQFLDNIDNVARHLSGLGISEGDRFAIFGQNTPEHYYCFYAASRLGAVIVPLNPHLTAPEVAYSFQHSEAKLLLHDTHVDVSAQASIPADRKLPISVLQAPAPEIDLAEIESDPKADFAISYSSGTTGNPKAIVLDQAGMIRVAQSGAEMWGITEADVAIVGLPLGYMYGLNTASSPVLHAGGTIVLMRRFQVFYADGSIKAAASEVRRADKTDPDQQYRSLGGDAALPTNCSVGTDSYLKARTALTVYQAQERQLAIQKKKGALVDRAQAEALVFRLARQECDVWVTWPARVAALMAAQMAAEVEKQSSKPVMIEAAILQGALEVHVRAQLEALADLRVSLG